jgi:hypothetical protein
VGDFPPLRSVQELFWRLITAPEGTGRGAAALRRAGALEDEDLSFLVPTDARMTPVERVDVYADMYFYRLRDCLAEDFPKVAAHVGAARFHDLVTDYLLAHPPAHFSLRELGRRLPGFLETHALLGEFPVVADLARLEWARVDVFDESDAAPLSREEVIARAGAGPEEFRLALAPCVRLLRVAARVLPLWREPDSAGEVVAGATGVGAALVWRRGFAVHHRSVAPDEERCLRELGSSGAGLAQLGCLLLDQQPPDASPQQAAERLAALLGRWAEDEILVPMGERPADS